MGDDDTFALTDAEAGMRFDRVVARLVSVSRSEARSLVETGAATLDGRRAPPSARVAAGSHINISVRRDDGALVASDVPFEIVHEDESFLVIDKPAGIVVHPGAGHVSDTLVNGLVGRYPELRDLGKEKSWGLVHRLDRDTSGLLVVARSVTAHASLQDQLRRRSMVRLYLALAGGREFDNATGTIEAPIARDPERPTRMAIVQDGRPSRTHYARVAAWPGNTLLRVTLDTGRTHQIRVHLSAISAALVGDHTYGGDTAGHAQLKRVWLHASRLSFGHPDGGGDVSVTSSLPIELRAVLDALGTPSVGELPSDL